MAMPSHHATPPCQLLSSHLWPTSSCLGDVPQHPEHDSTSPGRKGDLQRLESDSPTTPRHARIGGDMSLDAPEHAIASSCQPSPRSLISHTHSSRPQLPPRHAQSHRRCLSSSSSSSTFRHGTARPCHAPVASDLFSLCHHACPTRHYTRNNSTSFPCPFAAQTVVAMDDPSIPRSTPSPL
jgi:hypothetical protein